MKTPGAWPSGQYPQLTQSIYKSSNEGINDKFHTTHIPDCQSKRTKKTDQMTFKRSPWYAEQFKERFAATANAAGVTRRLRCHFFGPLNHRRWLDPSNDF